MTSEEEWKKLARAIREAKDKERKRKYEQVKRLRKVEENNNERIQSTGD